MNVLYAKETTWPLNALLRGSNGWHQVLWPPCVHWERAVSWICEEDWIQHRHCLPSRSCCEATIWREGKATYIFEQSDRSWIRQQENPGVELMLSDTDSSNANTSVPNVGTKSNNPEVNEELAEASRDNPSRQILEGQPLSSPSRTTFRKFSRICPKHPRHETNMTKTKLRETRSKSLQDQARDRQLNALNSTRDHWRPSKSPTMGDEHRTAREVYDGGKMKLDGGDICQVMRKAMLTPEGKWFTYPRTPCDYQKRPVSRRVCDSGHCEAGAEQKRTVTVPSADSCSWISHRKHVRWKAEEQAAKNSMKNP